MSDDGVCPDFRKIALPEVVPKRCRSRIGIYSKTCAHARGANICNFAFAILRSSLRAYFLSLTAFCMQKMLKIPKTVEEVSVP